MSLIHSNKVVRNLINSLRKKNTHSTNLGRRFVIDGNMRSITLYSDKYGLACGVTITKRHGKYHVNEWESKAMPEGIIDITSIRVVSDSRVVVDLINRSYPYIYVLDNNKVLTSWNMPEEDYGELPEGFQPVKVIV